MAMNRRVNVKLLTKGIAVLTLAAVAVCAAPSVAYAHGPVSYTHLRAHETSV